MSTNKHSNEEEEGTCQCDDGFSNRLIGKIAIACQNKNSLEKNNNVCPLENLKYSEIMKLKIYINLIILFN